MSNALAVIAQNTGASVEDITDVLRGMIVSAKNQHGAQATNAELAIVTGVCATYGLNPLVKECAAFVSGGVFVAEAHRLLRLAKAGAATKVLKPMRLFHFSITYVTLLFLAVAIDPIVHLAIR